MVLDSNFHLEVGNLFLRAGTGCLSGVSDLVNVTVKFSISVRVNFHFGLVADFHIYDVVFVHIDTRFHMTEVSHAHHFCPDKLSRGHETFAQFAVEDRDRAINRRVNCCLR